MADTRLLNPDESAKERLDRELIELLNEIRVALPGVQVLFAFLLALPFQARWDTVTDLQRGVYFLALCLSLLSSALLIGPSAYHRLNFRAYNKHRLVIVSNRLVIAGIGTLGVAMSCVMLLIADVLFGVSTAVAVAVAAGVVFVALWILLPMLGRRQAADTTNPE